MTLTSKVPNISLRHLRALEAICAQGSFGRAAAELGVVPSALSETVRQIELELGAPLFDRSRRPAVPTPLARTLLADVGPILSDLGSAFERARALAGLEVGQLAVGSAPSAITGLVAPALARFQVAHPGIKVRLQDDVAERLADQVREGVLDLAVAGRPVPSPELRLTLLTRDRFGLACAANHRLAGQETVLMEDLAAGEVIILDGGTGTQQQLAGAQCVLSGLLDGALHASSTIAQLCLIRAGLGVGLLPENAVRLFGDPAIKFIPVTNLNLWRELYLLERAHWPQSNASLAFGAEILYEIERSQSRLFA